MSMFLDSSRTLPDTKEGLENPDMSGILLDSPTLLLSWPDCFFSVGKAVNSNFAPRIVNESPAAFRLPGGSRGSATGETSLPRELSA